MTIDKKIDEIKEVMNIFEDPLDRYRFLMDKGEQADPFNEEYRLPEFKVSGCVSQVWLVPEFKNGIIKFHSDSDAQITKGVVTLFSYIYGGHTPDEITANERDLTEELNFGNILSVNRRNGAYSMLLKIKEYAKSCKT
tara:strand:+ start:192 stop:605 length:414 start_codon:yes stop_codon:yes gene_type:complete